MKEKQVSSGLKIFTFPKFVFSPTFPPLFGLTNISMCFGAVLLCLEEKMLYYCLCICLFKVFWSSFCGGFSTKITKSVNCCYTFPSTIYKLLVYFTLFIILLESTTSKMSRSSTYPRRFINIITVDAFQHEEAINTSYVSLTPIPEDNTVISGKKLVNLNACVITKI